MASFTDKAPTFNPYVQQQPVEAMVKVGMYKQQQYDQGVQRIQSTIDNVAGLDIARDIDKSYLRSKLTAVGKKLNTYAAGDYSNGELSRSLSGQVGSVANDAIVENAVRSTQVYKKGLRDKEEYTKKGKGSASNDWLFQTDAQAWLTSDKQDASFNSSYVPYTDYKKNSLEIVKNVLKDENISETDYYIDAKGQIQFTDITVREKVSGKSKAKIQSALMAGLSPSDWQQITIDGRYQYSNVDGESFKEQVMSFYSSNQQNFNNEKARLEGLIKSASSPTEQTNLRQQLDYLNNQQNKTNTEFQVLDEYFQNENFEGAKAKLYTMNWMDNMGNSFSSQENSTEMKKSVRAEFKFEREKESRRRQEFNWTFDQRDRFHNDEMYFKGETLAQAKLANKIAMGDITGYGAVLTPKDQNEIFSVTPEVLQDEIDLATEIIEKEKVSLGQYYTTKEEYASADKNIYPTYDLYAANFMDDQERLWKEKPWAVKTKLRTFFDEKQKAERVNNTKKFIRDQSMIEGNANFNVSNILETEDKNSVHNFTLENGEELSFTTEEIVNFNNKYDKLVKTERVAGIGRGITIPLLFGNDKIDQAEASKTLSAKEKRLLEIRFKEENDFAGFANLLSDSEQAVSDLVFEIKDKYSSKSKKLANDRQEFQRNFIAERLMEMQGMTHSIDLNTLQKDGPSNMDQFKNVLTGFAINAGKQDGIAFSPGVTQEAVNAVIPKLDNASITIVKDVMVDGERTTKNIVTATDSNGKQVSFEISQENMGWSKGRWELSPSLQVFDEYKKRIMGVRSSRTGSGGKAIGTTAIDGKATNKNNAYLSNVDFPNTQLFKISGNLVSEDGMHYDLELNIQNPLTGKWIENIEYTTRPQLDVDLLKQMQSMSDPQIFEMLAGRPMTQEDLVELQKASKKTQ